MLAITSKFLIRVGGKHVFNPANFAIIIVLALGQGWISPSQWGAKTWAAFLFASLAGLVLTRARRADMALAFLLTFAGFVFAREGVFGLIDPAPLPLPARTALQLARLIERPTSDSTEGRLAAALTALGPTYVKLNSDIVRYKISDVVEYENKTVIQPTRT